MSDLPTPPKEVPASKDVAKLAPHFRAALYRALAEMRRAGFDPVIAETLRSAERQSYLYGFGRDYDDGRGVVTRAPDCTTSWHCFGLAADVISASLGWDALPEFWRALGVASRDEGLVWGGDWTHRDLPHVQWGWPMRQTPSFRAVELRNAGGNEAVWHEVRADG